VKADGTMALVRGAHSTVFFDTGLPNDKEFILEGLTANRLQNHAYFITFVATFL